MKANKGSAGIDQVTIQEFERNLPQHLAKIQKLLKKKRYVPHPVKRVLIPKDNGKMRPLYRERQSGPAGTKERP